MPKRPKGFLADGLKALGIHARNSTERALLAEVYATAKDVGSLEDICDFMSSKAAAHARRAIARARIDCLPDDRVLELLQDLPQDRLSQGDKPLAILKNFIPATSSGISIGRGTGAQLVKLLSGNLNGGSMSSAGASVAATIVEDSSTSPSSSCKRWFLCALDGDAFRLVQLEVCCDGSSLSINALAAKSKAGYDKIVKSGKWSGDFEAEANAVFTSAEKAVSDCNIATSTLDQGFGVVDLEYSKPATKPSREDVPEVVDNYPAEDLEALLQCIDVRAGTRVIMPKDIFPMNRPITTPYKPDLKKQLSVGNQLGVIELHDAGDKRVNGKYIKAQRLVSERPSYVQQANSNLRIQFCPTMSCWILHDLNSEPPYKIERDVHGERRDGFSFPYDGVWEVHQKGKTPVPLTRMTCFHFRSAGRLLANAESGADTSALKAFVKLPISKTHPHIMEETQRNWPAGGGWGPVNFPVTQRSMSFEELGKKARAKMLADGTINMSKTMSSGLGLSKPLSTVGGSTLLPRAQTAGTANSTVQRASTADIAGDGGRSKAYRLRDEKPLDSSTRGGLR